MEELLSESSSSDRSNACDGEGDGRTMLNWGAATVAGAAGSTGAASASSASAALLSLTVAGTDAAAAMAAVALDLRKYLLVISSPL